MAELSPLRRRMIEDMAVRNIVGRVTASAIPSASRSSFFCVRSIRPSGPCALNLSTQSRMT